MHKRSIRKTREMKTEASRRAAAMLDVFLSFHFHSLDLSYTLCHSKCNFVTVNRGGSHLHGITYASITPTNEVLLFGT